MDLTSVELPGAKITAATVSDEGEVRIRLEPAYLIKTMTGSDERTRWWQNMELVFEQAKIVAGGDLHLPAICAGGDVVENVYTYRDMIPVPLESRGHAECDLTFEGAEQHLRVRGTAVKLVTEGSAKYIEHQRG